MASTTNKRCAQLSQICLGLPETTSSGGEHIRFQVRDKTFAYYLNNHHGDGRLAVCCKASMGEQDVLVRLDPARYFVPAYLGPRGWVGLRIDLPDIDWEEVEDLVVNSYQVIAPKRLADQVRRVEQ